jgi:hypothetical protein
MMPFCFDGAVVAALWWVLWWVVDPIEGKESADFRICTNQSSRMSLMPEEDAYMILWQ